MLHLRLRAVLPPLLLSVSVSLLLCSSSLMAHRLMSTISTVKWNPATSTMEVEHRANAHDIEHVFGAALARQGGIESLRGRTWLALQLAAQFELWHSGVDVIPLDLVGAELDQEFLYVYQEAAIDALPDRLTVRNDLLRSGEDEQVNYVNVYFPDGIRSLTFSGSDSVQVLATDE